MRKISRAKNRCFEKNAESKYTTKVSLMNRKDSLGYVKLIRFDLMN